MKLLVVAFFATFVLFSCSTIEDNSPALQGLNNNDLFRAVDSRAITGPDGSLIIQGENSAGEAINFLIGSQNASQVLLGGPSNQNIAVFTDRFGNQFSTAFEDANGEINYVLNGSQSVSGDFRFVAFTSGMTDTVTFSRGFIFEVPFLIENIPPIDDIPDATVEDQFTARINSAIFDPTIITSEVASGSLIISGQTSLQSIMIVLPVDTVPGAYEMVEGTPIFGSYTNIMGTTVSTSGTLQIISNDTDENIISGEFVFETSGGFVITNGAFVINY